MLTETIDLIRTPAVMRALADEYVGGSPEPTDTAVAAARNLAVWVGADLRTLTRPFDPNRAIPSAGPYASLRFVPTDNPEPYQNAPVMFRDIDDNNRLRVSIAYSEHPIWSLFENYQFRCWHDLGHYRHGLTFSPADELALFAIEAARMLGAQPLSTIRPGSAVLALFSESVYQLAYSVVHGDFLSPQRLTLPAIGSTGRYVCEALISAARADLP